MQRLVSCRRERERESSVKIFSLLFVQFKSVPNLVAGGEFVICLSSFGAMSSIQLTATNISITGAYNLTSAISVNLTIPEWELDTQRILQVFQVWIPHNTSEISLSTSSPDAIVDSPGMLISAYNSNNPVLHGTFQPGTFYYFFVFLGGSSNESMTINPTFDCNCVTEYSIDSTQNCFPVNELSAGVPTAVDFSTSSVFLYTVQVPSQVPSTIFYTMNVSFTNGFSGQLSFGALTFEGYGAGILLSASSGFSINRLVSLTLNPWATLSYLYPGSFVYIVVEQYSMAPTDITVEFLPLVPENIILSDVELNSTNTQANFGSSIISDQLYNTLIIPFQVDSSSVGYNFTIYSTAGISSIFFLEEDLITPQLGIGNTNYYDTQVTSTYSFFVLPGNLPEGTYFIAMYGYYLGNFSVDISFTTGNLTEQDPSQANPSMSSFLNSQSAAAHSGSFVPDISSFGELSSNATTNSAPSSSKTLSRKGFLVPLLLSILLSVA